MPADLIILAAIAIFVLLRLRAVLGRKNGHDVAVSPTREADDNRIVQLAPRPAALPPIDAEAQLAAAPVAVQDGLREAMKIDPAFRLAEFLHGAKAAFEMLIDAYGKGDRETLRKLLSAERFEHFRVEGDARAVKGQTAQVTLVAILSTEAKAFSVDKTLARITVAFESEQIHLLRDMSGTIIEGDAGQVDLVDDEWVFERDLKSTNPNWKIVAT